MKIFRSLIILCLAVYILSSCQKEKIYPVFETWKAYDETALIDSAQQNENQRLRYKLIQSKVLDKNELLESIRLQLDDFNEQTYIDLAPYIFEKSISEIQKSIDNKLLTYKQLTQWYLFRIATLEPTQSHGLNAIITINPDAVKKAEELDNTMEKKAHLIYGMPILLKDNINTKGIKTTAGALALFENVPNEDAAIVQNLKKHNAIILGKVSLSEWANFLCQGCPNGYSAVGGQTLNPYGMREFDTGGSSSGSGASIAANYAVAAVGTETSGSILSPSSQSALVGLKPTVNKTHQEGIVPISSTLDTPGPMSKTVEDNAILYSAMFDTEPADLEFGKGNTMNLGVIKDYMEDSLYNRSVQLFRKRGANITFVEPEPMDFTGFLQLLNGDMKIDLKTYLDMYTSEAVQVESVKDVVAFNLKDTLIRIPYGQARLDGVVEENLTDVELDSIRQKLDKAGKSYFEPYFEEYSLDAILSINNYNAGQAAVAKFPALTINMGFTKKGEPKGLTFIGQPNQEALLLKLAKYYEGISQYRKPPEKFVIQ
jgi:amidase